MLVEIKVSVFVESTSEADDEEAADVESADMKANMSFSFNKTLVI
jgi:hypothetical protein